MRTGYKLRTSTLAVLLAGGLTGLAAVPQGAGATPRPSALRTPGALRATVPNGSNDYILTVATTAGPLPRNFNPFLSTSVADTDNVVSFIYEPLVQWDPFEPQKPIPWLATSWNWSDGDKALTFDLRKGVKWSDGVPFTSADVVATFDLLKKYPAINGNGITFQSVTAQGDYQVTFHFSQPAYSEFYSISGLVYIVPAHIWDKIGNPVDYTNADPVGTGPYLLTTFSTQGFLLTKNPHYWMPGKPVIYGLRFPSYDGNGPANVAVEDGQVQWAGQFIPDIKKTYLDKSKYNNDWSPATSVVSLEPNLTKWPLSDLAVREAISDALNRSYIAGEAESHQATAQASATGVVGNENEFIAPQYQHDAYKYDPSLAKEILAKDGWKRGPGGTLEKDGKPLDLNIEDPAGFTDYMTAAQIISQELEQVGMHVTVTGTSENAWTSDEADGHFDMTIMWSNDEGIDPEIIYQGWLDKNTIPGGGGDYERWIDARTQALFSNYLTATAESTRLSSIYGMEGVMVNDMPILPLYGGPDWTQYNDQQVVGWPTPSNPYDPAAPFSPNNEVVVLHLRLR
jgi:peptide/nickel transport system substrate-binding protein